ncbi:phosphoenolpyruvate--protein phosphotransferase [candidate division WOR-3 bacterium]|nr:phosphoenolpyruvate--protein phosphotransferase [candidate division WOR-3 bacterium]
MKNKIFRGTPASPSIAIGKSFVYSPKQMVLSSMVEKKDITEELALFEKARNMALKQLRNLKVELKKASDPVSARLIDVQMLFLQDPLFLNSVEKRIRTGKESAEEAIVSFSESLEKDFKDIPNSYIAERYLDVKDIVERLLKNLKEEEPDGELGSHGDIVIAESFTASSVLQMSKAGVGGLIAEKGGRTSHFAILAEALNISAVVGANGVTEEVESGDEVIVDGISGVIVINPDEDTKRRFERKKEETNAIQKKFLEQKDLPATTIDGYSVDISANIELPIELPFIKKFGAKGVGLLRTEFLFLTSEDVPDEKEQYDFYLKVAESAYPDYVIMRTLDLGGDKVFKTKVQEENPFLGWRGVRFTLANEKIFEDQLRAMLKASAKGNVRILIPMVSQLEEIMRVKDMVEDIKIKLKKEDVAYDENIEIGAMVEIPSVPLMADFFSEVVDFFSIGTNDLTQYTLAVDRGNKNISSLFDQLDPSVIALMEMTVRKAHHKHKWVGICGDVAADVVAIPILIGMEMDELSLPPSFIPQIKNIIRGLSLKECKDLLEKAEKKRSASEVREFLKGEMLNRFPSLKNILVEVEND